MRAFQAFQIAASCDLKGELARRPLPQGPVRTTLIVLHSPGLDYLPGIPERREPMCIQTFTPERPVERFDVPVVRGLAGS